MRLPALWRSEPYPLLRRVLGDDFDRFFDEFFGRMGLGLPAKMADADLGFTPVVDVIDRDGEYLVKAELPGMAIEDISVTMAGGALEIKGEKKTEKEEKDDSFYACERTYGAFVRTIPLPVAVKADAIEAKLEKGILEIVIPKAETAKTTKIEIKGEVKPAVKADVKEAPAPKTDAPRPREERAKEAK